MIRSTYHTIQCRLTLAFTLLLQLALMSSANAQELSAALIQSNSKVTARSVPIELRAITFCAPDPQRVQGTWQPFMSAVQELDRKLLSNGVEYQNAWRRYLHLEPVLQAIDENRVPNYSEVRLFRRWLFSNQEGIDSKLFVEVRATVRPLEDALFTTEIDNLEKQHQLHLNLLIERWKEYAREPSMTNRIGLLEELIWFEKTQTDGGRIGEQLQTEQHSSLVVQIPKTAVDVLVEENRFSIVDHRRVHNHLEVPVGVLEVPLELDAYGEATTSGQLRFRFLPSPDSSRIEVTFEGETSVATVSESHQIQVDSRMNGGVSLQGIIDVTPTGCQIKDIESNIALNSLQHQATSLHRMRRLGNLARTLSESIINDPKTRFLVSQNIREHFRKELAEHFSNEVGKLNQALQQISVDAPMFEKISQIQAVFAPFSREGVQMELAEFTSSFNSARFGMQVNSDGKLHSPTKPPLSNDEAFAFCVHDSMIANLFQTFWSGKWVKDNYFEHAGDLIHSDSPYALYTHDRKEQWKLKFAEVAPFTIEFVSRDQIVVRLRCEGFQLKPVDESKWHLFDQPRAYVATYSIVDNQPGEPYLERTHFQVVEPNSSIPTSNTLEDNDFILRMDERMSAFLGEQIDFGGIVLPDGGEVSRFFDRIQVAEFEVENGWAKVILEAVPNTEFSTAQ